MYEQAALGAAQMDRADEIALERRAIGALYNKEFSDLEMLQIPSFSEKYDHLHFPPKYEKALPRFTL